MVILATRSREIGTNPLLDANCTFDANKDREFSIKIARCNWMGDMTFGNLVYVPDTEFGGIIEDVLTDTSLDYVELKGYTWRGRMEMKVIEPPSGSDYKTVSGELNAVLKKLIEPEFGGLYVVSGESTGVAVSNYQFDRYCTLLEGITKMLKTVGYRLDIQHKRERGVPGYILIRAVPIVDYSDEIELSKDSGLNYTMEDKRNGVNHLIVTGKGELKDRNTSQETWTPPYASSLFAKVLIPDTDTIPEWEQPESTNPYAKGDKVTHNGKTWQSITDNNVWEPGVYGWEEV